MNHSCVICGGKSRFSSGIWRKTCSDTCENLLMSQSNRGSGNAMWKGGFPKCLDCPKPVSRYRKIARCRSCSATHRRNSNLEHKASMRIAQSLITQFRKKTLLKEGVSEKFLKYVGCSVLELRQHLEKQFFPGMSWNNYGLRGWHVDHIKPLSLFDLHSEEELKLAFHYSNLQPSWWFLNLKKSNKFSRHECKADTKLEMYRMPNKLSFLLTDLQTGNIQKFNVFN